MPQENQKNSDNSKLRRHKTKNTKSKNPLKHYSLDKSRASIKEQKAYDRLIKEEKLSDNGEVNIGVKRKKIDGSDKYIIVDEKEELRRIKSRKYTNILIYFLAAVSLIIALLTIVDFFFTTPTGQKVLNYINGVPITQDGNYIFGEFDGFVTIGDNIDKAVDVLGFPEFPQEVGKTTYLHYNDSYIIIENETVVGYYKAADDDIKVTVGKQKEDIQKLIFIGDDAKRVVDKLGSPDHYLKKQWIYYGMDVNFERTDGNNGNRLTVNFDEKYTVTSITIE